MLKKLHLNVLLFSLFWITGLKSQTIQLTSQEVMWIDANYCNGQGPRGAWMSFTITNNGAQTLTNVQVEFDGFTGTNSSLFIQPTDSIRSFSSIPAGKKVPVYFYVDYSLVCLNGTPFDGKTANYVLRVTSAQNAPVTRNGTITTNTLLTANAAGRAISSTLSTPSIFVGQTFTQTVVYEFGNNTNLFFQPNCNANFPDNALRLVGSRITAGTAQVVNLVGYKDSLHFVNGETNSTNNLVTVEYTWYVKGLSPAVTVYPWAAAKSGQKFKYTGLSASQIIPASSQPIYITKSASPNFLPSATSDGGFGAGKVRWTVTLNNPSNQTISVGSIRDSIVPCMQISNPVVAGSQINLSNSLSVPLVNSNGNQYWVGLSPGFGTSQQYVVPASGSISLTYETDVTGCSSPSVRQNKAYGNSEGIEFGPATAYLSLGCNVPELSYPASVYCKTGTASPTLVGDAGGTYTGTAGLVINPSTGVINLAASSAGVHTVTYEVVVGQCTNTDTYSLTIHAYPEHPSAIQGDTILCQIGESTQLSNSVSGGVWISSNPLVATVNASGLVTSTGIGTSYITYKTSTYCGVDSVYALVSVGQLPSPEFSVSTTSRCLQDNRFEFVPTSFATHVGYEFNYGDGSRDTLFSGTLQYSYAASGSYEVRLQAFDTLSGCVDFDTIQVNVFPNPSGGLSVTQGSQCLTNNSFHFENGFVGNAGGISLSTYEIIGVWDTAFIGKEDLTYSFSNPGNYQVVLSVLSDSMCFSSDTVSVSVFSHPTPMFSVNDTLQCLLSNSFTFTNAVPGAYASVWNFGDGNSSPLDNPTHTYLVSDTFTVKLVATNSQGCKDSSETTVFVGEVGVPDFSFELPLCQSEYLFSNSSTNYSSVSWNFGDGTSSNDVHPKKTYLATGTYPVKLIINGFGCSDSITKSLTYSGPVFPVAGFTYTVADCKGTLDFTNTSTNAIEYIWDFGNGQVCTNFINNQLRSFGPGVHYVSLIAKGSGANCADTLTQVITVPPSPITVFSEVPLKCTRKVQFKNYSYFDSAWSWNFGDPTTGLLNESSAIEPMHEFSSNGSFDVRLITSNGTCFDTLTQTIVVDDSGVMPSASFTQTDIGGSCVNKIGFTNLSTSASTFVWRFHDGSSSTQENPSKTYSTAGVYPVTLVAVSSTGCIDSLSSTVMISQTKSGAQASFYPDDTVKCFVDHSFIFYNTSQYFGNGWIPKYYWDFGDGTTDTLNTFVYGKEYDTAGIYLVRLVAVAANGCQDTAYQQVQVKPSSHARFYAGTECTMTARIQNLSTSNRSGFPISRAKTYC
ncbi:MAG: PKD domain-containing protein [Bacteroidia bacterium]|nr:PKD domain-containing protein [Bacteroidia bacterium]